MDRKEFERKIVSAPVRQKLDLLKRCSQCPYNFNCWQIPENGNCKELLLNIGWENCFCKSCGWGKADPDPCEGCELGELYTIVNHQFDNEI